MKAERIKALTRTATAFLIALTATVWCWWATGPGLGLFLGAVLLAALYVPALSLTEKPGSRWMIACAATLGICVCWAVSIGWADVRWRELLRCCLVCGAFVWALGGIASALDRAGLPSPLAAAITVILALLWLTWPIWLSHALTQGLVNWLVPAHPLLAINGVLQHLGSWDRAPIAYRQLTILNQDIPYHLPRSILPAILLHSAIGAAGCWLGGRSP